MEELIKQFLHGYGSGDGDGSGYGDGYGSGSGSGSGYGYGDGYGDGYGSGYGYGDGDGYGYGDGYGSGSGSGDGDGSGSGSGDGYGYGSGSGYGDGDGYGSGYGLKLTTYKGNKIYYIDGIPCYFIHVYKSLVCAKVMIINTADFSASMQFVVKFNGYFAHGDTIKEAKEDAEHKWHSQLDIDEKISLFSSIFKKDTLYEASEFYKWHSTLTGSCRSGKELFVKQNNIDMNSKMTPEQFISITKNAYGGDIISRIFVSI